MKKIEPIFTNITKYNKNNYEQFIEFHNKKYNFSYKTYTIVMTILLIYCIIFNISQKNFKLMAIFIILLIIFLIMRLYLPIKRYQKEEKTYAKNKEINCVFSFYKYYFTVNKKTYYYFKLFKVFETKDYYYLYINEDYAALVSKTGFKKGNSQDFSEFIKKKCFFIYKNQSK